MGGICVIYFCGLWVAMMGDNVYFWLIPEFFLFGLIFVGFFLALFKQVSIKQRVNRYLVFLISGWLFYSVLLVGGYLFYPLEQTVSLFNYTFMINSETVFFKSIIILFYLLFIGLLYIDQAHHHYRTLELPFFMSLLFWIFLITSACDNFFFLFLLMEAITLLLVLSFVVYLLFFSPKTVKALLQFFIFNLFISIFYLFGVGLLLFLVVPQNAYSLTFINLLMTFDLLVNTEIFLVPFMLFLKIIIGLWMVAFCFKLTLAPLSN